MYNLDIGAIFVSNKVLEEGNLPGYMYREEPINDQGDSGWRVFLGNENEEYIDNPNNISLISAKTLIKIDEDIAVNLLAPVGISFERNEITQKWEIID